MVAGSDEPAYFRVNAGLAQLVEHVICNHGVAGSIPAAGTMLRPYGLSVAQPREDR